MFAWVYDNPIPLNCNDLHGLPRIDKDSVGGDSHHSLVDCIREYPVCIAGVPRTNEKGQFITLARIL